MDYCEEDKNGNETCASAAYIYYVLSDHDAESVLKRFGYNDDLSWKTKFTHSIPNWISLIEDEITSGRPVLYGVERHALVVDGFDTSNDEFHFNFGWGPGYNTWMNFEDLTGRDKDFTDISKHDCLIDIYPDIDDNKVFNSNTTISASDNKTYFVNDYIIAGNGSSEFEVEDDGKCWFIAGNSIKLLPGVNIKGGASFLAKIYETTTSATKSLSKSTSISENYYKNETLQDKNITIYPNPTLDRFWISVDIAESEELEVTIYDINGRYIIQRRTYNNIIEMDLSKEERGIYIVKIQTTTGIVLKRIILV